jgi:pimeloyl-ACP methyl ester carboxylesterase
MVDPSTEAHPFLPGIREADRLKGKGAAPVPTVTIASGKLEYVDKGRGVSLVLLHGGTGNIDEWGSCVDCFAERYRVIAYNRRGYGNSTPRYVFRPDFFEEDIEDLVHLLDALGVHGPVFLCGFSDGGTIALMFAVRHPERVCAMVCSGAHIYVEEKTSRGLLRVREVFEQRVKRRGLQETPQARSQRAWFDRWLNDDFRPFSIEDEISHIVCPTLVVQGMEDEFAAESHARRIADVIDNAELWLVEGARHWIHGGQHAGVFQDRVMSFLADK